MPNILYETPIECFFAQVMYAEILLASIGSLAYAEDDGRHILGVKATRHGQLGGSSVGKGTEPQAEGSVSESTFCCYVLECDSEVYKYLSFNLKNIYIVYFPLCLVSIFTIIIWLFTRCTFNFYNRWWFGRCAMQSTLSSSY